MKSVYTAILTPRAEGGYTVRVPDLPGCITSGQDLADALAMAADAANLWLCAAEDCGDPIPEPSAYDVTPYEAGEIPTLVRVDTIAYRAATDNRAVRKNVSLPAWMANMADAQGVNCSQLLQEALRAKWGI